MRRYLILATAAFGLAAVGAPAQAQMMGGYGYGGGYGMGPGMMDSYGGGPGAMYGYGGGHGPGMMYGYGQNGQRYDGRHHTYRGRRSCWHRTGRSRNSGYYGACP